MRVLYATYPMAFHTPGGGEVQLLAYEQHLPRHGVEVTRHDPWAPRFLEHDVVHYFSCVGGSSHICAFIKSLGLPLVVSSSLWMTEGTVGDFPIEEIRHQLFLADRVVTNSRTESETLSRILGLPREKFVEVPNAVDEPFLEAADSGLFRDHFGIKGEFVLSVGNIEPRKNQLKLVEAMRAHAGLPLKLVGGARDPAYLEAVLAAGGAQVEYLGTIPHEADLLRSAYAAASVFALPSLFETPGLAALEAAAQGTQVVITSEGSTRDYFGDTAYYADPHAVDSIAAAIGSALQARRDGERMRLTPATWHEATGVLADIYRSISP